MVVLSYTKLFSFNDGLPNPKDVIPRKVCDTSLFDHYTTLDNAIGIMEKGFQSKEGTISCFHRRTDPLFGTDMSMLVRKYGKFSEDGIPGTELEEPYPTDKPLKVWPPEHEAVIWHKPGVYWHAHPKFWRKKMKEAFPPSYIALTDCDNLFVRVPLSYERVGWVFKNNVVRIVFRQKNIGKAQKAVGYRDHLDLFEKRFKADGSIEWLAIEIPYYKNPKFDGALLAKVKANPQWLSPTKETVGAVFGTQALKKHRYLTESEL